ncbi:MAG: DUF1329 domain-containing protein [Alphaproteobacteria bacterium]|nr:DUF1329 domain-containing protein [Alphaproteobacteria bacterium]
MRRLFAAAAFCALSASPVLAADAARLDADLTPIGSERAGNADGTIPEWTGGITNPPAHTPGSFYADPFASDAKVMTIDASNWQQYEKRLTGAHQALFKTYSDYKMNVYPTRRSCSLPAVAYDWNKKNAVTSKIVADGNGIEGAFYAVPFPIPETGIEILWNHLLRYRGFKFQREYNAAQVFKDGNLVKIRIADEGVFRWSDPKRNGVEDLDNISIFFIQQVKAPARLTGTALLVHETINQQKQARLVWQYSPSQRRVRRAPDVQYDNPGTGSDAMTTSDSLNVFNGAPDRYEWSLIGKQEAYIPYNNYQFADPSHKVEDIATPRHLNQDLIRYELHRVWVIEGSLRPQARHIYAKRKFYIDEDSWFIVASELTDGRGQLWRVQEAQMINYYDVPSCGEVGTAVYDLQTQNYWVDSLTNETSPVNFSAQDVSEDRYTPDALRSLGH